MTEPICVTIDLEQTGRRIRRLMADRGMTVRDVQAALGFSSPQGVYNWLNGRSLPRIDNLVVLSRLLGVPIEGILITSDSTEQPGE